LSINSLEFNSCAADLFRARKGAFMDKDDNGVAQPSGVLAAALEAVSEALGRLRFGAVNLTVHDGKVVQIERKRLTD
jgi:hypothetical protein